MNYSVPGHGALAIGGGAGLARLLVHLFIWRLVARGALAIWRVPTFGPVIDILLGIALVVIVIIRAQRGPGWRQRRGGWPGAGTGGTGRGSDPGPRDW